MIKIDNQQEGCGQQLKQARAFLLTESILEKLAPEEFVAMVKKHPQKKYQVSSCKPVTTCTSPRFTICNHKNSHNSKMKSLNIKQN